MRLMIRLLACLVILGVTPASPAEGRGVTSLAAGFSDALVARVEQVTDIEPLPDGRVLLTQKSGLVRMLTAGQLLASPVLDLRAVACTHSELGVISVAADPAFASSHLIYVFYTASRDGRCVQRASRFTMAGDHVVAGSERVLVDGIPAWNSAGAHTGGDMTFDGQGRLYITVGDGYCDYAGDSGCNRLNDAGRDKFTLLGKLLRINRDGSIPGDNPWLGMGSARCNTGNAARGQSCREVYASGLRSPWRIDTHANRSTMFVNDVGDSRWEEVNRVVRGADYGWNLREGPCLAGSYTNCPSDPRFTDPYYSYRHDRTGCTSVTGGAFVPPTAGWPARFDGGYLYSDFVCGKIFLLRADRTTQTFASGLERGSTVSMAFVGSALYYSTWLDGEVRAIRHTGVANRAPQAEVTVSPDSGLAPLNVTLSGAGSYDLDGDTLTYLWSFGDGSAPGTTASPTVTHSYRNGTWTATLRVRDSAGGISEPVSSRIVSGNAPPAPHIVTPAPTARFAVGQVFTLNGAATDAEDGDLPPGRLNWDVVRYHNGHEHPYLTGVPDLTTVTAPEPESLSTTRTSWLDLRLTATDSNGVQRTVTQRLLPRLISVRLATSPGGGGLFVNGTLYTTPTTITAWAAGQLTLSAPATMTTTGGATVHFVNWSDGGARTHTVKPTTNATFTARYG